MIRIESILFALLLGGSIVRSEASEPYEFSSDFRWFKSQMETISWLQNFANGHWVFRDDMTPINAKSYGKRTMDAKHLHLLRPHISKMKNRLEGVALFLMCYRYDNVESLWSELREVSRFENRNSRKFTYSRLRSEDGPREEVDVSIRQLEAQAKMNYRRNRRYRGN